jgi:hypothetical protein
VKIITLSYIRCSNPDAGIKISDLNFKVVSLPL